MPRILLLGLCLLLAACGRGPDSNTLRTDLEQRLQQTLGADSLRIVEFRRQGSATDARAPAGSERRVVYFDATLELLQDRDFARWDVPGIASLVSLLGAGPRGLSGIESGGNQAGDRLRVHGSLIYQASADGWQLATPQGFSPTTVAQPVSAADTQREQLISAISTALHLSPEGTGPAERKIIDEEMARGLNSIEGRIARSHHGYALASGPESGQYSRFAEALAKLAAEHRILIRPLLTEGGKTNLDMLREGSSSLALSQSDVAWQAFNGTAPFAERGAYSGLRVLANLYPEPVQVLVRADGPQDIRQLRGKRINLGLPGSASRDTALAVLAAHDLQVADLAAASSLDLQAALTALRDGRIDGLIQVIGLPADAIRAASEDLHLRLLPLQPEAIQRLLQSRPGSLPFSIAAGSYPQQPEAVSTLAVSSLLLGDASLASKEVEALVRLLFEPNLGWLQLGSVQGAQISAQQALHSYGLPLHDGVAAAFEKP
ncbi:TAXI family TRAP transporter solute-binding subunit [Pseudomonas sp. N040]|uniref:TAXI family TRAP transporter solute-binding subunit n=1 Tax=Pseudomonas sp. N040 TaxID=2785325 RepID=UPI0018A29EDE|nr:TAXI family TRAP transporter solute-binding subunit [Pseudomonas sp. N040]MBF7731685.1 TAXI family TRAP transporter solute-binding subunit [Pseudomonas sp. N040]MBW7015329.1 TAXI family TRAP transporter solute-binding subunit [Pseudomonas sp. N040]